MLLQLNWWHVVWNVDCHIPLIGRIGLPQVLLKFLLGYFEGPGCLLDNEVFDKSVMVTVESSPGSLFLLMLLPHTICFLQCCQTLLDVAL